MSDPVETENGIFDSNHFYESISSKKGISKVNEAANALMTAFQVPQGQRGLLQALVGLSNGSSEEFEASHLQVGKRLYELDEALGGEEREKRERTIRDQVKKQVRRLNKWQKEIGVTLVSYTSGIREGDNYISSKFQLPILSLIQETMKEFHKLAKTKKPNGMLIAARLVASRVEMSPPLPGRESQNETSYTQERRLKGLITNFRKYLAESEDPDAAYKELTETLNRLKEEANANLKNDDVAVRKVFNFPDLQSHKGVSRDAKAECPELESEGTGGVSSPHDLKESQGGTQVNSRVSERSKSESKDSGHDAPHSVNQVISQSKGNHDELVIVGEVDDESVRTFAARPGDEWKAFAAFYSVGLQPSKIVLKNDQADRQISSVQSYDTNVEHFKQHLPELITTARERKLSLCVRWQGTFIQVDDCDWSIVQKLRPFSFAVIETSRQNYQVWLAIADVQTQQQLQTIRRRLLKSLQKTGANGGAYGSTRWPGTSNFKPERRTPTGLSPLIVLESANFGHKITSSDLEANGLLAPEEPQPVSEPKRRFRLFQKKDWWPDYSRCLAEKKSRSEADARYAAICLKAQKEPEEVIEKLLEVSEKAQERGRKYAEMTVYEVHSFLKKHAA